MSIAYGPKKIIRSATAGANHASNDSLDAACLGRSCDLELYNTGSVQLIWAGLTGTLNGTLTVQVSNDNTNWDTKVIGVTPAVITVSGAAGNDTLSMEDSITERYYKVSWDKVGVTGGTVTCIINAKG